MSSPALNPLSHPLGPSRRRTVPTVAAATLVAADVRRRIPAALSHPHLLTRCQWLTSLICFYCVTGFAIDFSGPLQNVNVLVNGSLVTYSVSDPIYGNRQGSASTPGSFISTPVNSGGVVAWVASGATGSTV